MYVKDKLHTITTLAKLAQYMTRMSKVVVAHNITLVLDEEANTALVLGATLEEIHAAKRNGAQLGDERFDSTQKDGWFQRQLDITERTYSNAGNENPSA